MDYRFGPKAFWTIFIAAILCMAMWQRSFDLGERGFWTDELYHVYAAQGLLEGRGPAFPSGDRYTRGLEFTRLVAQSFRFFGVSEKSARLPSVIISIVFLFGSGVWVGRNLGAGTGIVYVWLLGLAPYEIDWARISRFYSLFQALYFVAAVALFRFIERDQASDPNGRSGKLLNICRFADWRWLIVATVAAVIAYRMHALTVTLALGAASYVGMSWIFGRIGLLNTDGREQIRYAVLLLAGSVVAVVIAIIMPDFVGRLWALATTVLPWSTGPKSIHYYRYFLEESYPLVLYGLPLGLLLMYRESAKLALFVASFGLVPLLVLSIFTAHKDERYIYHLFPFLALPVCFSVWILVRSAWEYMDVARWGERAVSKAAMAASLVLLAYGLSFPWIEDVRQPAARWRFADWKKLAEEMPALRNPGATLIATDQNSVAYYFGRAPDFYLRFDYFERLAHRDAELFHHVEPIDSAEKLFRTTASSPNLYLLSTEYKLAVQSYVNAEMKQVIDTRFDRLAVGQGTGIAVYKVRSAL